MAFYNKKFLEVPYFAVYNMHPRFGVTLSYHYKTQKQKSQEKLLWKTATRHLKPSCWTPGDQLLTLTSAAALARAPVPPPPSLQLAGHTWASAGLALTTAEGRA